MDVYHSEDEQIEALKKWWEENGKSILAGIVLGLGAIFGWRAWQDHIREQAESASQLYQEMLETVSKDGNSLTVEDKTDQIITQYGKTTYAVFSKLAQARLAVQKDDYATAETDLRWALDNNSEDNLEHLIRIRLARVLAAQEKYQEAKTLLNVRKTGAFAAGYNELKGDIAKQEGNIEAARTAYQQALTKKRATPGTDTSILEMKLDDLGTIDQS